MITVENVLDALSGVRDPEIDESLTDLGFVAGVDVDEPDVRVHLRLPTYFCAPNFAYLMVADATAAVPPLVVPIPLTPVVMVNVVGLGTLVIVKTPL